MVSETRSGVRRRVDVLGVEIDEVGIADVCAWIDDRLDRGESAYVCVTGVHGVMESQRDPELLRIHNASGLTVADGAPIVWAARHAGADGTSRVYGPDMMLAVCERSIGRRRHFLYGGGEGTAGRLADRLRARFPGLEVAGTHTPPFRELTAGEDRDVIGEIDRSGAELIWVGLSTPKQERWMADHVGRLRGPVVLLGVGAAFDVHAGLKRDMPTWMGRAGLGWAFRLAQEPRRLWRRYARNNPAFVRGILRRRPRLINYATPVDR